MESGSTPGEAFLAEVNALLTRHPLPTLLHRQGGKVIRQTSFELHRPSDLSGLRSLTPQRIFSRRSDRARLRKCESCVVHFFDARQKRLPPLVQHEHLRQQASRSLPTSRESVAAVLKAHEPQHGNVVVLVRPAAGYSGSPPRTTKDRERWTPTNLHLGPFIRSAGGTEEPASRSSLDRPLAMPAVSAASVPNPYQFSFPAPDHRDTHPQFALP